MTELLWAGLVALRDYIALHVLTCLVPAFLRGVRLGLVFLILRPFDVAPALWNRLLGWIVVRLRVRVRDVAPP